MTARKLAPGTDSRSGLPRGPVARRAGGRFSGSSRWAR